MAHLFRFQLFNLTHHFTTLLNAMWYKLTRLRFFCSGVLQFMFCKCKTWEMKFFWNFFFLFYYVSPMCSFAKDQFPFFIYRCIMFCFLFGKLSSGTMKSIFISRRLSGRVPNGLWDWKNFNVTYFHRDLNKRKQKSSVLALLFSHPTSLLARNS